MFESELEQYVMELLDELGWSTAYGPDTAPGESFSERADWREVVLEGRLRQAMESLNPTLPMDALDYAVKTVNGSRKLTPSRQVKSDPLVSSSLR